jgi:hypothetical protein
MLAAAVAWLAVAWWAQRAEARQDAAARHPSRRKAVSGLPVDGQPLSKAELDEFTEILLRPAREPQAGNDGKPPAGQEQDSGETR